MTLLEMLADMEYYLDIIKTKWQKTEKAFPSFFSVISKEKKAENEKYLQTVIDEFHTLLKGFHRIPIGRKKWKQKTLALLKKVLFNEEIIYLHTAMEPAAIDSLVDEIFEFLRHVRSFAPELNFENIGQALRNYIVYTMFKEIHQVNNGFHMPAFGYSMLYPFTDNYIDSGKCTKQDKAFYNQIIRDKIKGNPVHPISIHQTKTCDLLQAIASNYSKEANSCASELLLMMLEAQELSISQQDKDLPLSYQERLNITAYKGGISVLIDRFFVDKEITEEDLLFYLGFGFFLQLADDLQDINEDSNNRHSTLFTFDLHKAPEEGTVNQLLNLVHSLITEYSSGNDRFMKFILSTCYQLIFISAIQSKEFFFKEYLSKLEDYLPVTLAFLDNLLDNRIEKADNRLQRKYMKLLDVLIS